MGSASPRFPQPRRGQIWFVAFPSDPPGKGRRPVLIVSTDVRNMHPQASTVLVVPLSTTLTNLPTHLRLKAAETGLPYESELQPENLSTVRKESLHQEPGTRTLGGSAPLRGVWYLQWGCRRGTFGSAFRGSCTVAEAIAEWRIHLRLHRNATPAKSPIAAPRLSRSPAPSPVPAP